MRARRSGGGIGSGVWVLALAAALVCLPGVASARALRIHTDFGPENARRPLRPETRYIVLHTTEGREAGSLGKLRKLGEAHYFVHRDGRVTRLLDRRRIATHSGRSMWNGRSEIDEVSLGIEVSGYHDREPPRAQLAAVKELVRQLQSLYDIPDDQVLTHSMVAYGTANRFHPYRHRGRKRCAMVFARPAVRERIGLTAAPRDDPDVRAGRLRVGDPELERHLYPDPPHRPAKPPAPRPTPAPPVRRAGLEAGADTITPDRTAWSIAGRAYARASTVYVLPDGTRIPGDRLRDWDDIPAGTRVLLDQPRSAAATLDDDVPAYVDGLLLVGHPAVAADLLGGAATAGTTTYLFPSGSVRTGAELSAHAEGRRLLTLLPSGTRVLVGYVNAGRVTSRRSLTRIAGERWNYPSTYYRTPGGAIRTGAEIGSRRVPTGTHVFFRH